MILYFVLLLRTYVWLEINTHACLVTGFQRYVLENDPKKCLGVLKMTHKSHLPDVPGTFIFM